MGLSAMRKVYMGRFVCRCLALLTVSVLMLTAPGQFDVLQGGGFWTAPSLLHILWLVWVGDMLAQLFPPTRSLLALGSLKSFRGFFRAAHLPVSPAELRRRMTGATRRAYGVLLLWATLVAALGILHAKKLLGDLELFWLTCFFYVCDLICVLFWCPFRHFIMKNRCCTTCRIFDWDHLMMFSPLIFVGGFYCLSLVFLAVLVFLAWELTAFSHPERFDQGTNQALKCAECTDLLCIHARELHPPR